MGCNILIAILIILVHQCNAKSHHNNNNTKTIIKGKKLDGSSNCNIFDGSWEYNDDYTPIYDTSACPFISDEFDCQKNGRPDQLYLKYRWKPTNCALPSFDGQDFLTKFRGKKIMFVGDSLSLDQWQSLTCMLHASAPQSDYTFTNKGGIATFFIQDYNISVMLYRTPYLVDVVSDKIGRILKLDSIQGGNAWIDMDLLIFNSWHWWVHNGSQQTGWDYIQKGTEIYKDMDRLKAYKYGMITWSNWVKTNTNSQKTQVFFQNISPTHYRIEEGKTYKIGRFQTVRNHGFHLSTTHKYRIRFGTRTTIDEIECGSIPKHGFKFVSFEDIISNKLEGRQLIDVIGGVEDYNAVFVHNNTKRMALDLANQDDTQLSFWMWGPYTKDGEHIATNLCHKSEKPVIVMQCVERIVTQGGHIRLSTVDDVSKIYVNPEIPEAHYIRTRLSARPGRSKGIVERKNKTILDESCKTLQEIMCTELAGKYVTVAYLNEIDDTFGWYRNICQKCTSPVGKRHGKWYCSDENCIAHEEGSENRATRFKVRFIISDDNGAKANLIMYDKQIKKKVAKTPLECLDKLHQVGNDRGVPQELTSMLRKKYVLKLVVDKRYNLELSSRCYTVVDYSDELRHIEAWTEQYKMIQEMSAAESEIPDSMGSLLEKIQYENQVLAASNAEDDSAVKGIHNDESVEKILTLNMTQESVVTSETQSDYLLDAENETGSHTESLTPSSKRILFETYKDRDVQDEASAKKGKSA